MCLCVSVDIYIPRRRRRLCDDLLICFVRASSSLDQLTDVLLLLCVSLQVQKAGGLLGVTSRGLLILALLLVFIVILLVIIVVLAALWPRNRAQEAPKVCDTPACLRAAAQVPSQNIFHWFFFWLYSTKWLEYISLWRFFMLATHIIPLSLFGLHTAT